MQIQYIYLWELIIILIINNSPHPLGCISGSGLVLCTVSLPHRGPRADLCHHKEGVLPFEFSKCNISCDEMLALHPGFTL